VVGGDVVGLVDVVADFDALLQAHAARATVATPTSHLLLRARRKTTWADEVRVTPPRWVMCGFAAQVVFLQVLTPIVALSPSLKIRN
jgi:hypothetical protein